MTRTSIAIQPRGPVRGRIRPPGSKSITNRALICAALARGESSLHGALDSEDTRVMIDALRTLGLALDARDDGQTVLLTGCDGRFPTRKADLFLANSGTSIRFLTAAVALGEGEYRLDGIARMRERPIADLLLALNQLGADVESENGDGCPPVKVSARGLDGGSATVKGNISSQFLSALLMAAPYARRDCLFRIDGPLVSAPYVRMTIQVMQDFGVQAVADEAGFHVPAGQGYRETVYEVEPDASAASYFWATAAITGGSVTVEGLSKSALQGDVRFCDCLRHMGCDVAYGENEITVTGGRLRGITVDMNSISDTVQTLAVVALMADGPTTISNVAHIRHKETDRIGDLARELEKLGAAVQQREDGLTITPGALRGAELDTYDDHRMAMSLALVGLRVPGVVIRDPGCTRKTYPGFFADLEKLTRDADSVS